MRFLLFGFLVLAACYNPPRGIASKDHPIEFKLSNRFYADKEWFELHDPRITPVRFRGIYLRVIEPGSLFTAEYTDIEHLPDVRVVVADGKVAVIDPSEKLLRPASLHEIGGKNPQVNIVVYVR